MYVCVYTYTLRYIHTYIHTYTCWPKCMYACMYETNHAAYLKGVKQRKEKMMLQAYVYDIYTYICTHTLGYMYAQKPKHSSYKIYMHTYACTYIRTFNIHMSYTHAYIHTYKAEISRDKTETQQL